MTAFQHDGRRFPALAKAHRKLLKDSAVSALVAHARGYQTVRAGSQLANAGFWGVQASSGGLLIPVHWNGAPVLHQLRPDEPRMDDEGRAIKYETPAKARMRLDCSPVMADALTDPSVPLWITEGVRKGDAAASAGLCCVALLGVWNWTGTRADGGKGPLDDWDDVALADREVFIAYDSDVMVKDDVRGALERLTAFLVGRGARVRWVFLPPGTDPMGGAAKVGLDDYLAEDHTAADLLALSRRPEALSIRAGNRQLRDMTDDAVAALALANEPPVVFQRAGHLVEAQTDGVSELGSARLQYRLANVANWYKVLKDGTRVPQFPDKTTVQNVAVAVEQWPFPVLDRVVSTPVFAVDGSLRTEPGYHPTSRTLYQPPADLVVPTVPGSPSVAEVQQARKLVDELFSEFPFASASDRAHAWALFLQPFARELIRGETPLYGVEAPKQGTGKTLLVRSALAAAVGHIATGSDPRNDEEMRKRITAAVVQAEQAMVIDNVIKRVDYPSLASALTSPVWHDRILGETRNVSAPIFGTWVLTGNNPQYSDDIARRVVPIRLDSHEEHPQLRSGSASRCPPGLWSAVASWRGPPAYSSGPG